MKIKVSVAEILDKLTILEIKRKNIKDHEKLLNINKEYTYLKMLLSKIKLSNKSGYYKELLRVNSKLWDIEEDLRNSINEKNDRKIVKVAKEECLYNDRRAEIKKRINIKYNSEIVEEKSYEHL